MSRTPSIHFDESLMFAGSFTGTFPGSLARVSRPDAGDSWCAAHVLSMGTSLRITPLSSTALTPSRAHPGDAGLDLTADKSVTIDPGAHALVGTGLSLELPSGTVGMVCPRSGLAARHGVTVLNAPGIVDENYRGEVGVVLINHGSEPFLVEVGMRIAQLVITPYLAPAVQLVDELQGTTHGAGGFGSTGIAAL